MSSGPSIDIYPGERTLTETDRLHAQHDLVTDAFGGLILCPIDLNHPGLHILDLGTADGWWLHCLRSELPQAESATLVGTYIAEYPGTAEDVRIHDFKQPFPTEWNGNFDLVQLRAVLANVPGDQTADLLTRVFSLVKPGGYIQLVDGALPSGELTGNEKPSQRFLVSLGNFLNSCGLNADQGALAAEYVHRVGGGQILESGSRQVMLHIGKTSRLEETSWSWLRGMDAVVGKRLVEANLLSQENWADLRLAMLEEAKTEGFSFPWYSVWARKSE